MRVRLGILRGLHVAQREQRHDLLTRQLARLAGLSGAIQLHIAHIGVCRTRTRNDLKTPPRTALVNGAKLERGLRDQCAGNCGDRQYRASKSPRRRRAILSEFFHGAILSFARSLSRAGGGRSGVTLGGPDIFGESGFDRFYIFRAESPKPPPKYYKWNAGE